MLHPNIPPEFMKERPHIRRTIEELIAGTDALIELGKDVMFSVNSTNPGQFGDLMPKLKDALLGAPVEIQFSGRSIEVIPQGVTKAQGLAFWAETTGAAVTDTVSIGDADNDLEILKAAGHAAALQTAPRMSSPSPNTSHHTPWWKAYWTLSPIISPGLKLARTGGGTPYNEFRL